MTEEVVETQLVPLAAELVATIRDYGPDDVAAVLARVPDGRHDALAVVLAAMVDPDQRPSALLAWTHAGPVKSRDNGVDPKRKRKKRESRAYPREHGSERGFHQHRNRKDMPACAPCYAAHSAFSNMQKKARLAAEKAAAKAAAEVFEAAS